jgi:hypothetical protein
MSNTRSKANSDPNGDLDYVNSYRLTDDQPARALAPTSREPRPPTNYQKNFRARQADEIAQASIQGNGSDLSGLPEARRLAEAARFAELGTGNVVIQVGDIAVEGPTGQLSLELNFPTKKRHVI